MHRSTINYYANAGEAFLQRFIISFEPISELVNESKLKLEDFVELLNKLRERNTVISQPDRKPIFAENVVEPQLSRQFNSIGEFSRYVQGDRGTIRQYVSGQRMGQLYRKQWKFTVLSLLIGIAG